MTYVLVSFLATNALIILLLVLTLRRVVYRLMDKNEDNLN